MTATLTRPAPERDGDGELIVLDYEPLPPVLETLTDAEKCLYAIFLDQSGLDLAEMCWIDESNPNGSGCFRAYPYQWSWWRDTSPMSIDQGARSVGKALDVTTRIPTPLGWTTMGEIVEGDEVLDDRGRPCKVTRAYEIRYDRPCYQVQFDNGTAIVADADHRWSTRTRSERAKGAPPSVRTTTEIAETLRRQGQRNHSIDIAGPIEVPDADLPVGPYTLGAWLGDGSSYRAHITAYGDDGGQIRSHIEAEGYQVNDLSADWAYGIAHRHAVNHKTGTVTADLRRLGLIKNRSTAKEAGAKAIPLIYQRASIAQRTALLQGLMDTDGHITPHGRCEITLKSERLSRDTYELLAGLGQKPYFEARRARCNGVDAGIVYRVGFHPQNGLQPFRLGRKAERVRPPRRLAGEHRVAAVVAVASVPVRCIEVDSPSHLFLAGDAMIPTHNSESIIAEALAFVFQYPMEEFVIVTPEGTHADALTDRMEARIQSNRLIREMLVGGRSGINHRPFKAVFKNGARIMSRLPQRSGIGVKGIHPIVLHVDEAQDVSKETYAELPETVRWNIPGARWRCHGVSRGVQDDDFYTMTQPDSGWKVHHISKLHTPHLKPYTFRDPETGEHFVTHRWTPPSADGPATVVKGLPYTNVRSEAVDIAKEHGWEVVANWLENTASKYGGRQSQDFKRNVLGLHGASMNRIFMLDDLMAITDDRPGSAYNEREYRRIEIRGDQVAARAASRTGRAHDPEVADDDQVAVLLEMIKIPGDHLVNYKTFWMGLDFGVINDPTEIVILAEYELSQAERRRDENALIATPAPGRTRFKLLSRIQLQSIAPHLQARVVMHLIDGYKPKAFSMDKTGNGVALYREVQRLAGVGRVYVMPGSDDETGLVPPGLASAAAEATTVIKGYGFKQKVVIGIDQEKVKALNLSSPEDILAKATITANVKDAATDFLRDLVDQRRLMLPHDADVRNQLNSQVWISSGEPVDAYGRRARMYSNAIDHILDAFRMFVLGMALAPLEDFEASTRAPSSPTYAIFG